MVCHVLLGISPFLINNGVLSKMCLFFLLLITTQVINGHCWKIRI